METRIPIIGRLFLLPALLLPARSLPLDSAGITGKPSSISSPNQGSGAAGSRSSAGFHDAYAQAIIFIDAAEAQNIKVSPEEVAARMAAYGKLYPGEEMEPGRVENLLKAEKYLATRVRDVNDRDVDNRLSELGANGNDLRDGNRDALRQALRAELLFTGEETRQLGEKTLELSALRNQELMENSNQEWPLESLRLIGSPEECLASLNEECWATLEEYNAVVGEIRTPRFVPLDSARAEILRTYLAEKHVSKSGPAQVSGYQADSILQSMKDRTSRAGWRKRMQGMGRPVMDQKTLWETYYRHYRELFKARMQAEFEIVGSSDSIRIDSLYRALKRWEQEASAARATGQAAPEEPAIPWLPIRKEDMPRLLSPHADSLKPGESTRPVKTHLGFFLAKVRNIRPIREISFEMALTQVIFLATRDKFLRMDSVLAAKSLKYYQAHRDEFRIPDTLDLTAWLVPFTCQGNGRPRRLLPSSDPGKDTSHFAPLKISSLLLTRPWQNKLRDLADGKAAGSRKSAGKPFIGPLKSEYGQWYFRIDKARKARGFQTYAAAKQEIIRRLTSPEIEPDTLASDSAKDQALLAMGAARYHQVKEISKWETLPEAEIQRLIDIGDVDTSGFPRDMEKARLISLARQKLFEQTRYKIQAGKSGFLKEVEIHYARLFKR